MQADPATPPSQEHASEYGVHWNFFFTLGIVPVFGTLFDQFARWIDHSWMAIIISAGARPRTTSRLAKG